MAPHKTPTTISLGRDDRPARHEGDFESGESSDGASSCDSNSAITFNDSEINWRQIQQLTQRVESTLASKDVDTAYKEYAKVKDHAALCRSLLRTTAAEPDQTRTSGRRTEVGTSQEASLDGRQSYASIDTQSWFSGSHLDEDTDGQDFAQPSRPNRETFLSAVREWKNCIESLLKALRRSLSETYKSFEPDATPKMVESLFRDRDFRASAIQQMRNAKIVKAFSASPNFSRAQYDIRFRNHDRVKQDLLEITRILQLGESGLCGDRQVNEHDISPRGDAILEFANLGAESMPLLRFRVSSFMLAETSPIFERMFTDHTHIDVYDDEDVADQLPPPPTPYICNDGSEAKLYRMPQTEPDREQSLKILLHAAHMHNDKVPREVSFEQFVAIAEVCLRYRCTSPLELFVEHRWLPQWIHKGSEDMPDGLLLISYAFGFRQLFTRMSKTTILNLVDEKELQSKPWPQKIKDKVWAVRGAKMAQVHACCVNTVQEYLRPPSKAAEEDRAANSPAGLGPLGGRNRSPSPASAPETSISRPTLMLSSSPRCPKGNHWCDATNLGWLMLIYGELQLLPTVMKPAAIGHLAYSQQPPRRSLAQLVDLLRTIASPPQAVHKGGVCDPAPQFRAAINDIYNSVSGLTLHDISGRAHGWGLSRHRSQQPQAVLQRGLRRPGVEQKKKIDITEAVRLKILRDVDTVDDLYAVAMTNKGFYQTFKDNELMLMRKFVKAHRRMTLRKLTSMDIVMLGEDKVPKKEGDILKTETEAPRETKGGAEDGVIDKPIEDIGTQGEHQVQSDRGDGEANVLPDIVSASGDPSSPKLSDEEAQRILWPDSPSSAPSSQPAQSTAVDRGMKEKFRRSDPAFVEDKMLLEVEDKQLREERDRRVGLVREDV